MKITELKLENVKCFERKELSLVKEDTEEPLSVCALVGANGSGKSAILKAIVAAFTVLNEEYAGELFTKDAISKDKDSLSVELSLQFNEQEKAALQYEETYVKVHYAHIPTWEGNNNILYVPDDIASKEEKLDKYLAWINNFAICNQTGLLMYYDPFRFVSQKNPAGPNIQEIENPKKNALASNIGVEGDNSYRDLELKQWLVNMDYMRLKEPTARNQLIYEHIIKSFDLLLHPLKFESISQNGSLMFINENDGQQISIDMLSDGFKSIFSIVLDIIKRLALAPDFDDEEFYLKEAVVLIDEIDCHIHPKWQKKLMPAFRELFPNCQFIITTHSPYILDTLQEYEVIKVGEKNIL